MTDPLDAGDLRTWLHGMRRAVRGETASDVPCDGCTACCRASQFVVIAPDERDTIAHIPKALLFPAPRLPRGHVLLGYDERGHCPMLVDDRCTIYSHRPRTCRTYDCRVFPAAGIEVDVDDDTKAEIAARTRRWRFSFGVPADHVRHDAVRAAALFFAAHADELGPGAVPANPTQRAALAVAVHAVFVGVDDGGPRVVTPTVDAVRAAIDAAAPSG